LLRKWELVWWWHYWSLAVLRTGLRMAVSRVYGSSEARLWRCLSLPWDMLRLLVLVGLAVLYGLLRVLLLLLWSWHGLLALCRRCPSARPLLIPRVIVPLVLLFLMRLLLHLLRTRRPSLLRQHVSVNRSRFQLLVASVIAIAISLLLLRHRHLLLTIPIGVSAGVWLLLLLPIITLCIALIVLLLVPGLLVPPIRRISISLL